MGNWPEPTGKELDAFPRNHVLLAQLRCNDCGAVGFKSARMAWQHQLRFCPKRKPLAVPSIQPENKD